MLKKTISMTVVAGGDEASIKKQFRTALTEALGLAGTIDKSVAAGKATLPMTLYGSAGVKGGESYEVTVVVDTDMNFVVTPEEPKKGDKADES